MIPDNMNNYLTNDEIKLLSSIKSYSDTNAINHANNGLSQITNGNNREFPSNNHFGGVIDNDNEILK